MAENDNANNNGEFNMLKMMLSMFSAPIMLLAVFFIVFLYMKYFG